MSGKRKGDLRHRKGVFEKSAGIGVMITPRRGNRQNLLTVFLVYPQHKPLKRRAFGERFFGNRKNLIIQQIGTDRRRRKAETLGNPLFKVFFLRFANPEYLQLRPVFGDAVSGVNFIQRADRPRIAAFGKKGGILPEDGVDLAVCIAEKGTEVRFAVFRLPLLPFEETGKKDPPLVIHHFGKKRERTISQNHISASDVPWFTLSCPR